jgi:predicted O-methyltransferase YrrM
MSAGQFTEEWFSPASCAALAALARSTLTLDGRIIEVGCWEGKSTVALANAVAPATVHAVDTWQGSPGEISSELASQRDVFATFLGNVVALTAGNIETHRMGWREYLADDLSPVRFIHIDAEHTYREVADNVTAVLPLMVPGGVICGDDVHHAPVIDGARAALGGDVQTYSTLWYWQVT